MSKPVKSLKSQNRPALTAFIIYCLAVYIVFTTGTTEFWKSLIERFDALNSKDGMVAFIAPILCVVITGILSVSIKEALVFFRYKNALPGHRAFSKLAHKDKRFKAADIENKMGIIPEDPDEQNAEWFKLYKRYESDTSIIEAHKIFLLTRDLTAISFIFLILGTASFSLQQQVSSPAFRYFIYMLVHYLSIGLAARNYGNRFVTNVFAVYVTDHRKI
ncbi:MAG: hypothetical protein HQ556_08495 [Candidatus Marinimicrobia bacterium]|nr:hypothetical protein [Candidatus Neomarinimicrobiota bacterium]